MTDELKPTGGTDPEPPSRLSRKEFAKKLRHATYQRAKEHRKTDPRVIAMKEEQKKRRRAAYQEVKARGKVLKAERKQAADQQAAADRAAKQKQLVALLVPAVTLKPVAKRTP